MVMPSDAWAPPVQQPAGRARTPWVKVLAGLIVGVLVLAGVRWYVTRPASVEHPRDAIEAWIRAAETGDADAVRKVVAPSQRAYVSLDDPTGTGLDELHVEGLTVGDFSPGYLSPDEGYLDVAGRVCPASVQRDHERDPRCRDVKGSGAEDRAMVVREDGRWWAVAAPVRLVARPQVSPVTAVISQRLELRGGLEGSWEATVEVLDRSCRNVELAPYGFRSDPAASKGFDDDLHLQVSSFANQDNGPADVIEADHVTLRRGRSSWRPAAPVRVQRAPGNTSGSLLLQEWKAEPIFDDPAPPPVSGRLTWTCRDER